MDLPSRSMSKKYAVKEIYFTLQGEGHHSGRPAVFCRFSGCNLWSGREEDRATAICRFCDTDFWGTDGENGGKYELDELVNKILDIWPSSKASPFVVFTGGEPALQMTTHLIQALKSNQIEIAIETNGTMALPEGIDWICMSPKANTEIVLKSGQELKIVYPQKGIDPLEFMDWDFEHFYIQPMDDENQSQNIQSCVAYCKQNPKFKLSLQTHKILDIP